MCNQQVNAKGNTRLRWWAKTGTLGVIDQACFAGANLILNILLARWLTTEQYGAFVLAYSVFLLVLAFHNAVLTEPMLVFGASKYGNRFGKYLGLLVYGHLALMILLVAMLVGVSFLLSRFYSPEAGKALLAMSLASPMILLLWIVRRAFYARLRPAWAAMSSGSYLVVLLAVFYLLWATDNLSQFTIFFGMGLSSLFVSVLFIKRLQPQWVVVGNPTPGMIVADHWNYGRWALATAGATWLSANGYVVILSAFIGLQGIASLRALTNLVLPVGHGLAAISAVFIPTFSGLIREGAHSRLSKAMGWMLSAFVAGSLIFLLLLAFLRKDVLNWLYADKYVHLYPLVPIVGLLPLGASIIALFGSALRASERPDKVFWGYVVGTVVSFGLGLPLAATYGVQGALWGLSLSYLATAAMLIVLFLIYARPQFSSK